MRLRFLVTIGLAWLVTMNVFGQNDFKMFFEKAYISTDRDYYAAGEDIWLQAYLVNAQTNIRINTSANLYVELLTPDGTIMSQETLHLINGLASGDFVLPAGASSGNYHIRAYTNWMKNFGTLFMFEKQITVAADATVKTKIPKGEPLVARVAVNTATAGVNHLYFFPEGGAMVEGLTTHMAVKATDANGKGIIASGKIVLPNGDAVAGFETNQSGLGSFDFTPATGMKYTAKGKYYSREIFTEPLPQPLPDGLTLSVKEEATGFVITIRAAATTIAKQADKPVYIIARHVGKKCYSDSVRLTNNSASLHFPKDSFPDGLSAITLYDADMKPQCERLVFTENKKPLQVSFTTNSAAYQPRDSTIINISVTDAQNRPVTANLSFSATDAGLIETVPRNIVSYLSLESEIKGEIENPLQYFDDTNKDRKAQLDLLLQTQGWRSFSWRRLKDTSIVIKYLPEPGITIAGRVRRSLINKGISDMNVTLYAEKSSGDKLFFTKTQADGRFFLDGLPLSGLQNIKLVVKNDKNKKEGMILLDSVLGKPLPITLQPNLVYDTSIVTANFWNTLTKRNNVMREQEKKAQGDLGNVTVTADPIKKERIQEGGLRFGKADSLFIIQPQDKAYETVARFIIQRYPGAYTSAESNGFFFYGDGGVKILPRWMVDGNEDRFSTGSPFEAAPDQSDIDPMAVQPVSSRFERVDYYNIPINKVKKIYVEPQVSRTGALIYIIHLSLLPGAFETNDLAQIITQINGYYEARQYYVPDFSPNSNTITRTDLRSTIFWVPDIKTDANGKASIRYRNSDAKTKVRIRIEGITYNGEPVAGTKTYEVK